MMLSSSLYCGRPSGGSFYKNSNSDDLLLHNQIVLYWDVSAAYNFTATAKTHRTFGRVVCPGVSVRPAGRYVRHYLMDGAVYFWLLHVRASIECPSRRSPRSDDFQLRLSQWIDRSRPRALTLRLRRPTNAATLFTFLDINCLCVRPSIHIPSELYQQLSSTKREPENLTLSCSSPQRIVTLQGRLRLLVVSWDIFPSRFCSQSDKETLTSTNQLLTGLKTLPADLKVRVQITSRLHFDGELSQSRRRQLCEFYGFWCNGSLTEDTSQRRRQHRRSDSGDEVTGTCIRPSMRCDGLPDCWLDDPLNSPDEVGCSAIHPPDSAEALSPFETFNESFPIASSPPGRGQSWTAKLPWMVVAFVPAVLLCALVRICSQRRQLDFATIDGDLHALEATDTSTLGAGLLRRPHSLPAFENAGYKKSLSTARGRNFLAIALRRSRSTEDVLPHPPATVETLPMQPLKVVEPMVNTAGNYSHLILAEDVLRGETEIQRDSCSFQLAPIVRRNRSGGRGGGRGGSNAVNRMIMSCWSGDLSISSTTSSSTNSPITRRGVEIEEGENDCDVCRQMRESALMVTSGDDNVETLNVRSNRSHSSCSATSTPSTTSTSAFAQHSASLDRPAKSPTAATAKVAVEFRQNGVDKLAAKTSTRISEDPLLDALKERTAQYDSCRKNFMLS
ncbi:hypothetical protein TcWFU_002609 [Taenia crassiceps]|uniref:Uncharacterized protein n=1 Tax=Taenia crassiceps TaxID=6207 RepID=A0ABR4Q7W0_9CEST